jgi:hemolysin III
MRYTRVEEWIHAATHGLGALLGIVGLILLILQAISVGRPGSLAAVIVYGVALILLYSFSSIHHALTDGALKQFFLSLDHTGIYLLIAGTYTPFCLLMPEGQGWGLFGLIWGLALIGITTQSIAFLTGRSDAYERFAFAFHLAMGWVPILWAGGIIFGALPPIGLGLLIAGGIAYSVGVLFYLWRRIPYNHAIWHLFVVGGSTFHFFSILLFVVPLTT